MSKARDLANAGTALTTVSATELGYLDGVTSAVQTQLNAKEATLPSQTGNSGKYLTTDGTNKSWATVSTGLNWTPRLGATNAGFRSIAYNGSNLYVAVGTSGQLYSSPDAITWTSRTSGFGANAINDVAYGNGLWVAVGGNGTLTTSSDGTTWTARTANFSTNVLYNVVYANSTWVAVGGGGGGTNTGGIIYSTDGTTWTRKSQTLSTLGTNYYTVVWNGTNWIVGAEVTSTNNYLYASAPSGTWTAGATGSGGNVDKIIWDGTRHITWENTSQLVGYSTSTTLGTTTEVKGAPFNSQTGQGAIASMVYYNNKIYITNGRYLQSFTPTSTAAALVDNNHLLPSYMAGALPSAGVLSLYVNASGIVALSNYGAIWTSF